ncbi:hypothetical protein CJI52_05855 [Bifidobacteriaceae bacterium WP022]|nr:hypothetical protein CJI52_05855 [Bifidobacteriaceae bacterium WP022]
MKKKKKIEEILDGDNLDDALAEIFHGKEDITDCAIIEAKPAEEPGEYLVRITRAVPESSYNKIRKLIKNSAKNTLKRFRQS